MTFAEASKQLPATAQWSASFGNPGEGGYVEYWRTPTGERWTLANDSRDLNGLCFSWRCQKVAA